MIYLENCTSAMRRSVCDHLNRELVSGSWAILHPGRVPLVEQSRHNDDDGGETIGGPDCVDVGDGGVDGGDGVYDTSACNDLFYV